MTKETIISFLQSVDKDFVHNLSQNTNFEDFAKKAIEKAHCEYVEDINGMLKGLVVGYANDKERNYSYISFVAVNPNCRKQGIAKRLMLGFINYAKSLGFINVIGIHTYNPIAKLLYENIGFNVVSVSADNCFYLEFCIND